MERLGCCQLGSPSTRGWRGPKHMLPGPLVTAGGGTSTLDPPWKDHFSDKSMFVGTDKSWKR